MARPVGSGRHHKCHGFVMAAARKVILAVMARPDGSKAGPAASSGAAGRDIGDRVGVLGYDCGGWGRRDLHPSLAQPKGLVQAHEELLFAVIVPPPPAAVEFEKIRASALGQVAPFLRDLLECMRRWPFRHGEAVSIAVRDV